MDGPHVRRPNQKMKGCLLQSDIPKSYQGQSGVCYIHVFGLFSSALGSAGHKLMSINQSRGLSDRSTVLIKQEFVSLIYYLWNSCCGHF